MAPTRAAAVLLGCSASLLATGCADDGAGATSATSTTAASAAPALKAATVSMASFRFVPGAVTVTAGAKVTWINRDKAPHTAENTGEPGPAQFDSGRLNRGQSNFITFTKPGTYRYYCVYHRFMEANVIVR